MPLTALPYSKKSSSFLLCYSCSLLQLHFYKRFLSQKGGVAFPFFFFFGAAPPCGRVGLCRGSQACSALRRQSRLGLALRATTFHPSAEALRALSAASPPIWTKKAPQTTAWGA